MPSAQKTLTTKTGLGIEEIIGDRREQVLQLARRHGVRNVRVFGSVAYHAATPESDVDFLVDGLENAAWGGGRLLIELQDLLQRPVDLVTEGDLHDLIRDKIVDEAIPLLDYHQSR
jgi:predicted nucleotidyltransferase